MVFKHVQNDKMALLTMNRIAAATANNRINHAKSPGATESDAEVKIFKESLDKGSVRYVSYIGHDGASDTA